MSIVLWFANICGLVSFTISGFMVGRDRDSYLITAVLTTFGGGAFLRDIILLGMIPAALTDRTELYICIAIAIVLQNKVLTSPSGYIAISNSAAFKNAMLVADALGCGSYLTAGVSKGILYGLPNYLCVAAGVFPAIGGGVIALIWIGTPFWKAVVKNPMYKLMVVVLSIRYYQLVIRGKDVLASQTAIIIATLFLCVMQALSEYFIRDADNLYRRFVQVQDNPVPLYLPISREVYYCFAYRGKVLQHVRFPNLNRSLRIQYHMRLC